jgi:protein-S-isoprenylcysteine O-methyltransferase Ste14
MSMSASVARPYPLFARPVWRRRASYASDAVLIVIFCASAYVHLSSFLGESRYSSLLFSIEQAILVGIFLSRRRSEFTSRRARDWAVAAGGSWLVYAAQPHGDPSSTAAFVGQSIQCAGIAFTIVAFLYLGRSFGIVAANRGLKVNGPYRLVRHPIYLAHAVTLSGFVVANFGWYNLALFLVVGAFQLLRIRAEEQVLLQTTDYAAYSARVRWRLLPGVY